MARRIYCGIGPHSNFAISNSVSLLGSNHLVRVNYFIEPIETPSRLISKVKARTADAVLARGLLHNLDHSFCPPGEARPPFY